MGHPLRHLDTVPRRISVFGATGSIGCNTLDLIRRDRSRYVVEALTAYRNVDLLIEQALEFRPKIAVIGDDSQYGRVKEALSGTGIEVAAGEGAVVDAACRPVDWTMAAIVGAAGLEPTLRSLRHGGTVALANKECLVCAGNLFMREVERHGATLLPVDSEHNAIFQVFDFANPETVDRIILTASGGPFWQWSREEMRNVTPEQAVAHPNWSMGAKISIDSATMFNKGLELIEAFYLFPVGAERIDVLVHPQSVVHSLVSYIDGSVLAQLGSPDMRTPISFTLGWPDRIETPARRLNLAQIGRLDFTEPDLTRFPALRLAREVLAVGGSAPIVFNAANEIAVAGFLERKIGFLTIAEIVQTTLEKLPPATIADLDDVRATDREARALAQAIMRKIE